MGFASGIMMAASVWSLLLPALELCANLGTFKFLPPLIGFLLGGLFLTILDKYLPQDNNCQASYNSNKKLTKLFIAITVHNIPEGLAVGFAFGSAHFTGTPTSYLTALALAIGIGFQNFPEGAAVSIPISNYSGSHKRGFTLGVLSGIIEPISAGIGFFLASILITIQPWLLSFAAGAMVFVVSEELVPESQESEHHIGTWGIMIGFALMMVLDVLL